MKRVFRLPFSRKRLDVELLEEFRFHMHERTEQFIAAGMTRAEAETEVTRRFGDVDTYRTIALKIDEETMRQRNFSETIDSMKREMKLAGRVLLRTPAFSLIAFLTLALGIGASTAIFTVLDAVVLRPLPYDGADRLVSVLHPTTVPGSGERKWGLSAGGYFYVRSTNKSFSNLGMYTTAETIVTNGGSAEVVVRGRVTPSVFAVLNARPETGRLFDEGDAKPDSALFVVLSYEYWMRRFGGDRSVIGKNLETDVATYQIIGVTQPGLNLPMPGPFASTANLSGFGVDIWTPLKLDPAGPFYNSHQYTGVARLRPGVTVAAANREINELTKRLPDVVPNAYSAGFMKQYNFRGEAAALKDAVLGPVVPKALWALFGSVILVLLIAVANVANLFMVRMDSRRREATIRTALGADGMHMATHYMSESMLLCGGAALAGIAMAAGGLRVLLAIAPTTIPRLGAVTLSWQSIVFAAGLAVVMGAIFGAIPLLRRGVDMSTLREGGRGLSMSRTQRNARAGLVVAQMALALVLLACAGLMMRSFAHLRDVRPGLDPAGVLAFDVNLPFTTYDTREKAADFHRELQRRIAALPGVTSIGSAGAIPLDGSFGAGCSVVFRENRPYAKDEQTPCVHTPIAAPGFFEALHIPVRGRTPTWADFDARTQAVVITKALGDRLWPHDDPIGKGINTGGDGWYRIVGVIPELRAEALDQPATEAVFYSASGFVPNHPDGSITSLTYVVRTSLKNPMALAANIRALVTEMNPRVPLVNERSMTSVVAHSMQRTSFIMILLAISATVALTLSAVGTYGVISYVVTQRQFEIGVRIALGARVGEVARLVVMQSMRLAAAGVILGLIATAAVTGVLRSLLFNVSTTDPVVLVPVAVSLIAIAALASFAPARRAARIDPVEALRRN